jgi:hypothetical protein
MKRWQDWLNLVLGAWMLASPWALGFADAQSTATQSALGLGAAIVMFSRIAVSIPKAWEQAIGILLGVALIAAPWALHFAAESTPTLNAVIVGVLLAAFAAWAMSMDTTFRDRQMQRQQTK